MRIDCLHGQNQRVAWPHALVGDQPGRQAHNLEETLRIHNTKQDEKMLYFIDTTHEDAETVILR